VVRTTGGVETTLVLNTDYTVTLNADQDSNPGGSVTTGIALAVNYTLIIASNVAYLQPVDLQNLGGFYPEVINDALDKLTILVQQLQEQVTRSLKLPISDPVLVTNIATADTRKGLLLGFDPNTGAPLAVAGALSPGPFVGNVIGNLTGTASIAASLTNGSGDQAKHGMATRVPQAISVTLGTVASPTTGTYLTKPQLYLSRIDSTDASAPITGLLDGALVPIALIEGTNPSTTTSATMCGLAVNLYGLKANSQQSTYGNQIIGIGIACQDEATPNTVAINGVNPNVIVSGVPAQARNAAGGVQTARAVNGIEIDVTNNTAVNGVFEQTIGNMLTGMTILHYSTNATPSNGSYGLVIDSGTTSHGWAIGQVIGSSVSVALLVPQTHISNKPDIGIHVASQGGVGIQVGTGSTTYSHGTSQVLGNPTIGFLLDAQRAEGATSAVQSNTLQFRAATGAATYQNWKEYIDNSGNTHWQTDKVLTNTFVDAMKYNPNATAANSSFQIEGIGIFTNTLRFKNASFGANYFELSGTPTAARTVTIQDSAAQVLVARDTTDTLTNKTLTAPVCTAINTDTIKFTAVAPTVSAAQIGLGSTTASTVGAAGGASALPATPTGYWIINVAGTNFKVPYYAN
jgi:hypothetical protein